MLSTSSPSKASPLSAPRPIIRSEAGVVIVLHAFIEMIVIENGYYEGLV